MCIKLLDADARIGKRLDATEGEPTSVAELLAIMDRLRIDRAVVSHYASWEAEILLGNDRLREEIAGQERLIGSWTLVPDSGNDVPSPDEFVDRMLISGARVARLLPKRTNWTVADWCAGPLLNALEDRRVPAVMPDNEIGYEALHDLLQSHPQLPVILTQVGYRANRSLIPLLQACPNLHVTLCPPFATHELPIWLCEKVGADRMLFGTSYPESEPGAAITLLTYSGLPDEDQVKIGSGNIERLISEVKA